MMISYQVTTGQYLYYLYLRNFGKNNLCKAKAVLKETQYSLQVSIWFQGKSFNISCFD